MKPSEERKLLNNELYGLSTKRHKGKDEYNRMNEILKRLKELEGKIDG